MKYARILAALMVFAFILTIPVASAEHATQTVDPGSTNAVEVSMAEGHTLFVAYESNNTLNFMVVDPNGNVVKNMTGTMGGYMVEAQTSGDYRLVWQSYNQIPTSLNMDYYNDMNGLANQLFLMIVLALIVLAIVVIAVIVLIRRKK